MPPRRRKSAETTVTTETTTETASAGGGGDEENADARAPAKKIKSRSGQRKKKTIVYICMLLSEMPTQLP